MSGAGQAAKWQQLFGAAFRRSENPMALLSTDRVIKAVNPAFVTVFGYRPEQLVGRRSDSLVVPGSQAQIERDWAMLTRTGRATADRKWTRADGRVVETQFAAQTDAVDAPSLVLIVAIESHTRPLTRSRDPRGIAAGLTPRQRQVVSEIAIGRQVPQIAKALGISPATVRTHVRNAMDKLGARTQAQLVAVALVEGNIDPPAAAPT